MTYIWRRGTEIFSGPDDDETIKLAKLFIEFHKFTKDDVQFFKKGNQVIVKMIRDSAGQEVIGAWSDWKDAASERR